MEIENLEFSEYGDCPNCGAKNIHICQLGNVDDKNCCMYCYTKEVKIKTLKENGWYQYYSNTHWVHKDICTFFEKTNNIYYGKEHTNHQMSIDDAFDIYLKCQ